MGCFADGHLLAPNGHSYVCGRESSLWSSPLRSRQCDVCVVQQKLIVKMPLGPTHCIQHHITEFPSTANTFGHDARLFKLKPCQWMPEASFRCLALSLYRSADDLRVSKSCFHGNCLLNTQNKIVWQTCLFAPFERAIDVWSKFNLQRLTITNSDDLHMPAGKGSV